VNACPTEDALSDLAAGRLPADEAAELHRHVRGCEACGLALAAMAEPAAAGPGDALKAGDRVGRYQLVELLGVGGMGAVWSALDTELGRSVALKTLRAEGSDDGFKRLLREAQAMAALSHPNVVTVHEVVAEGGRLFLAMELASGGTLRDWLDVMPRQLDEVLQIFIEAGRGLAVAHAAGLVHRDFKPENVLVDGSGSANRRVRVTDFGLARASGIASPAANSPDDISGKLTQTGALMGTPAYMAPEQMRGEAIDARADIFGFCIALYEAVYREKPLAASRFAELQQLIEQDQVSPSPRGSVVPGWLRQVLLEGLRAKVSERWDSMDLLLAALEEGRQRTQRRKRLVWITASGLVLIAALSLAAAQRISARSRLCTGSSEKLLGVWDAPRAQQVQAAFAATNAPFADDAWQGVSSALGAWRDAWVAMRTDACEATRLRGEQSEELLDLRMQCLDQRKSETRELVDLYSAADRKLVQRAVQAAGALTPLTVCADARLLRVQVREPSDEVARSQIAAVQKALASAKELQDAGKYQAAIAVASPAVESARAIGYRPLLAEALSRLGSSLSFTSDSKRSVAVLREAALSSEATNRDYLAAGDWTALFRIVGDDEQKPDEALQWADHAEVDIARLGGDDELEEVRQMHLGSVLSANSRHDEAVPHFQTALALAEKKFGPNAPKLGNVIEALAAGLTRAHRNQEALVAYQRALPLSEKNFGPHHPSVARLLSNMSAALMDLGHLEEAAAASRRALDIIEASDKDSYLFGATANNLGDCLRMLKKPGEAEIEYRKAMAFHLRNEPAAYQGGDSMIGVGGSLTDEGKPLEAIPYLEKALKHLEVAKGPAESLASGQFELARALWDAGKEHQRAIALAKAAHTTFLATHYEPDAQRVADWLSAHK
jgi:serine/threonine protein kinase/tetratricopeptide (TPR) repeat protein